MLLLAVVSVSCGLRHPSPPRTVPPAAVKLTTEDRYLLSAAINQVADQWKDTISVCLAINGVKGQAVPPDEALTALLNPRHPVVTGPVCAHYTTGLRVVMTTDGKSVRPTREQLRVHRLKVDLPVLLDQARATVYVTVESGTDFGYVCQLSRPPGAAPARCELRDVINY